MRAFIALIVLILLGAAALRLGSGQASAAETITYKYDARGRLVKVTHTGTANDNVVTNYVYDDADNRELKNVSPP